MQKKKNKDILVSIIIPAYNEEKYIGKCLDSVLNQTLQNFEIIVINDGSTDSTSKIADRDHVRLITISHGGPGQARNYGAKIALGKILVFVDADMILDKNYLRKIIVPIIDKRSIGTYTTAEYIANRKNFWAQCWNITHNIPVNRRINVSDISKNLCFRAILKNKFLSLHEFNPKWGYMDDKSLDKHGLQVVKVDNAICYHYNPETLMDVFYSARWIGRSIDFKLNVRNLLRYSIINSIYNSMKKIVYGAPVGLLIFKIVFDFGILSGIFFKNSKNNFAK